MSNGPENQGRRIQIECWHEHQGVYGIPVLPGQALRGQQRQQEGFQTLKDSILLRPTHAARPSRRVTRVGCPDLLMAILYSFKKIAVSISSAPAGQVRARGHLCGTRRIPDREQARRLAYAPSRGLRGYDF